MVPLAVQYKWLLTLCIILMMCPKRTRLLPSKEAHKQEYDSQQDGWREKAKSVVQIQERDDIDVVNPPRPKNTEEAGFELTEQEMIKFKIWPQGVIPYYIDVYSFSDKVLRDKIRSFLNSVNSMTSLNFLELPSPPEDTKSRWVFFVNRRGLLKCADHSIKNFTNEGVQQVVLGYDCLSTGDELSEALLSIVGVPPQHNAPNRDNYIQVLEDNIMPEKKFLFEKLKDDEWLFHEVDYDFSSAGHFHFHRYSVNGRATFEAQENFIDIPIAETKGLSLSDFQKIKMLYNYIAKKTQMNIPECHKLFEPRSDFSGEKPEINNLKPREKPKKYLGLTDSAFNKQNENKNEKVPNREPEDTENSEVINPEVKEHNVLKYQWDPLSVLSDYQTGDERLSYKKKKPLNVRPGAKDTNNQKELLKFKKIGQ